ncbi:hypothetical protein [Candidatus Methylocalor cossyra]|uniref:Porin n=1 Tax=Candidatus Methylocalor cossyra TaxID=3108543 RepID=A0ABM9NKM0_9GAMM
MNVKLRNAVLAGFLATAAGAAAAEPVVMGDKAMDQVTAGSTVDLDLTLAAFGYKNAATAFDASLLSNVVGKVDTEASTVYFVGSGLGLTFKGVASN